MPKFDYWQWLAFGIALMALEMLAPSTYFLWMGLAAMLVGGLLWLNPEMGWQAQVLLFAVLSMLAIFTGRRYIKRHPIKTDHPTLNKRGAQYLGRQMTLDAPIINGVGRERLDDTQWKVFGPDLPAGARVEVIGVEGTALRVRPLETAAERVRDADHTPVNDVSNGGDGGGD